MITLSRLPWFDLWLFKNLLIVFQNCDLLWKPPKSLHTSSEKESVSFTDIFWFDSDSLGETYGKQIKTSDIIRYKKYYYSMSEGPMRLCSPLCCCCPCWAPLSPSLCLASFHSSLARRPSHFVSLSHIHPSNFLLWCAKWCPPLFSLKHKIDHFYQITYPVKKLAHCCNFPLEVDVWWSPHYTIR